MPRIPANTAGWGGNSNGTRDGSSTPTDRVPRHVRAPASAAQQVPLRHLLHAVEMPGPPLSPTLSYGRLTGTQDERHSYEKCQYAEFKKRVAKMEELRAAKGGRSGLN